MDQGFDHLLDHPQMSWEGEPSRLRVLHGHENWPTQDADDELMDRGLIAQSEASVGFSYVSSMDVQEPPATWREISALSALVTKLSARVAQLEAQPPASTPKTDPISLWLAAHRDEVRRHAGRHVAVSDKGVVAEGTSYGVVHARCKELGVLGQVVILFVRP